MGEPPHRYLVRLRIERAKELLVAQRTPITEVALAVGFGSSAHFSTVFRKHVGVAPTVWRRERMG
jgi:AraC family transcriptional regulator